MVPLLRLSSPVDTPSYRLIHLTLYVIVNVNLNANRNVNLTANVNVNMYVNLGVNVNDNLNVILNINRNATWNYCYIALLHCAAWVCLSVVRPLLRCVSLSSDDYYYG